MKVIDRINEIERIIRYYKKEINKDIKKVINKKEIKEIEKIRVLSKVEKNLNSLLRRLLKWTRVAIEEAYEKSRKDSVKRLKRMRVKRVKGWDKSKHLKKKNELKAIMFRDYYKMISGFRKYYNFLLNILQYGKKRINVEIQEFDEMDYYEVVDDIVKETIEKEQGREYASDKIINFLKKNFEDGVIIINGRKWDIEKYAIMLARTNLIKAQSEAVLVTCDEYDNDLVEVSSHDDPCEYCAQFEGKIYSISGRDPIYPMLVEYPPYHPNCEHSISPTTAFALKYRQKYNKSSELPI